MQVQVIEHYSDRTKNFDGSPKDIVGDLMQAYPFLLSKLGPHASIDVVIRVLDHAQAYSAREVGGDLIFKSDRVNAGADESVVGDQLGGWHRLQSVFAAAAFLSGRPEEMEPRLALLAADEDAETAALLAYGLEPDDASRAALRAVLASQGSLEKAEGTETLPTPQKAVAATPDGSAFAEAVQRALDAGSAFPVTLGGKHSAGSLLAMDPKTQERFLLKPGSGPQSPAAGAREESASQAKREAAAYAAAKVLGIESAIPEAHLLLLDGAEFAGLRLLPFTFKSAIERQKADPGGPRRLFSMYLPTGRLHQWAAFDYIIGQTDRHAGNVMTRGDQIFLIDHGAAFAGKDFSPATDRLSFVPFYLRALAPGDFAQLDVEHKLRALPRLSAPAAEGLRSWLQGIDEVRLGAALSRHGVDPGPSLHRLEQLRAATAHSPADLAINGAWVIP